MTAYLLYMKKKKVSSVDEKMQRNDNNQLRNFILPLWGVKIIKRPKVSKFSLIEKRNTKNIS